MTYVKKVTTQVSLELTLTPEEGDALVEYLDIEGEEARRFRVANQFLYTLQGDLVDALNEDKLA